MNIGGGKFGYLIKPQTYWRRKTAARILLVQTVDWKFVKGFSTLRTTPHRQILLLKTSMNLIGTRGIVSAILGRALSSALKVRYWVLGGAVGGGVQATKRYEEWKDSLPDMTWIKEYTPNEKYMNEILSKFHELKDQVEIPDVSWLKNIMDSAQTRTAELKQWLDQNSSDGDITGAITEGDTLKSLGAMSASSATLGKSSSQTSGKTEKQHEDVMQVQIKYQKEIQRLEKENRELRKHLMLKNPKSKFKRKFKKSLIDIYSEVLDELSDYDSNYDTQDHLPRVVVVGDQSSGKTSVLEMVAQARIFPRGSGEMMTRAPVKVTLSEGPYHIAQFNDSTREFDLTNEADLADLRHEVEIRMKKSVAGGKTVSNQVISMTVKGPGIQRMVLVDLPGIISTVTKDMASDTRECIREMTKTYMSNPNAIILCIQDGSVDAERSNVTDLVSQVDPQGKRTILVLTKVDLAEENLANPDRVKKILQGKLFPMKSIGNFAVVTGRGNSTDSIQTIKKYEEDYFSNSKLFKDGSISTSQLTTQSLSFAVSECFWKMVKESVEQQADAFKASRFNLETEWKHNYPHERELDRDELYEKARSELLDEVVNLSMIPPKKWEELLSKKLWEKFSPHVFENIYLPAAQYDKAGLFNVTVDIKLKQWAEQNLPQACVDVGWETLREEFIKLVEKGNDDAKHDKIFDILKKTIVEDALNNHKWEGKAADTLRVLQLNTLEDRLITEKQHWIEAVEFLESNIKNKLELTEKQLHDMVGPSFVERWLHWNSRSNEQHTYNAIKQELDKMLGSDYLLNHKGTLNSDELTTVKKNLQTCNVEVDNELIKQIWFPVYRKYFLTKAAEKVKECSKCFYIYQQGLESEVDCNDIILFWRLQRMIHVTTNTLRQQLVNREARRLEKEMKDVLDKYGDDEDQKKTLLKGGRIDLAEELKSVRRIQDKLEEFIQALNSEK